MAGAHACPLPLTLAHALHRTAVCLPRPAGTDGCSEPISLLVRDALTQRGAFMSPFVATLSRVNAWSLVSAAPLGSALWQLRSCLAGGP